MNKIRYHYSALSKQAWFYSGILYLMLLSIVMLLVKIYHIPNYGDQNLIVNLGACAIGMIVFFLLSMGHHMCYSEYDAEKVIFHNRVLRREKTFYYKDAKAVIFDKWGVKFYAEEADIAKKEKPLFYIPFFRDGKIEALDINRFFYVMQDRQKNMENPKDFQVFKTFKVLPGYGKKWKSLSFGYACLTILALLNCAEPLAVIIGLVANH